MDNSLSTDHKHPRRKDGSMKNQAVAKFLFSRHALQSLDAFQEEHSHPTTEDIDRAVADLVSEGWLGAAYQVASLGASDLVLDNLTAALVFDGRGELKERVIALKDRKELCKEVQQ
jgi:hypothetical protein